MGIDPVDNNYGNYYSGVSKPTPDQFDLHPPKDCDPHQVYLYCADSLVYYNQMNPSDHQDYDPTDHNTIESFIETAGDMENKYLTPQDQESLQSMIAKVQAILSKFDQQ